MIPVKGHPSNVYSWSEVMALKLRSLCPNHSESKMEDLILWVSPSFDPVKHACL